MLGLAVLHGTITAVDLGALLAARTAGFLAAVPVAGVLADRHSRRGVVLWSGLAGAVALPVTALALDRSTPLTALACAVAGAGQGACRPAFQALAAEVVDEAHRRRANAALSLAVRVTTLAGPSLTTWPPYGDPGRWLCVDCSRVPPCAGSGATVDGGCPAACPRGGPGVADAPRPDTRAAGLSALTASSPCPPPASPCHCSAARARLGSGARRRHPPRTRAAPRGGPADARRRQRAPG
ncbi:MFS transporter [Streptomyces canarius]